MTSAYHGVVLSLLSGGYVQSLRHVSAGSPRLETSRLVDVLEQGWVWFVCPRFGLRREDSWAGELLLLLMLLTRPGFVSCAEFEARMRRR